MLAWGPQTTTALPIMWFGGVPARGYAALVGAPRLQSGTGMEETCPRAGDRRRGAGKISEVGDGDKVSIPY